MSEIKTRANIAPSNENPPYDITTAECEKFIQKKFNNMVTAMRNSGDKDVPDIQVTLITTRGSDKFFPFVALLPLDVLASSNHNTNELSIFNPQDDDGVQKLKKEFYTILSSYMYNKADRNGFNSGEWRRALNVSNRVAGSLHLMSTPRIQKVGGRDSGTEVVLLLLDPMRVMHDMLVNLDNKNEHFKVKVKNVELIQKGNYMYKVERRLEGKGKKTNFKDNMIADINRAILGRY